LHLTSSATAALCIGGMVIARASDDLTVAEFDHTGFPNAEAMSLANRRHEHYWAPMAKVPA
jgi:hypothetical protein